METPIRFRGLGRVELLGGEVPVATTPLSRLLGLALLSRRRAGTGLLIPRCSSVHTFGMRFRLDVHFLDEVRVIELRRAVPPGRVMRCRAAMAVLEVPSPGVGQPRIQPSLWVSSATAQAVPPDSDQ